MGFLSFFLLGREGSHGWAGSGTAKPLTSPSCPDSAPAYPWRELWRGGEGVFFLFFFPAAGVKRWYSTALIYGDGSADHGDKHTGHVRKTVLDTWGDAERAKGVKMEAAAERDGGVCCETDVWKLDLIPPPHTHTLGSRRGSEETAEVA